MNQDKYNISMSGGAGTGGLGVNEDTILNGSSSVNLGPNSSALGMIGIDGCCYDETELLSKLFTKDLKSGGNNLLPVSVQV
jgi:hypothetical protein